MEDKKIKETLRSAIEKVTPDCTQDILKRCEEREVKTVNNHSSFFKGLISVAAILAIVFGAYLFLGERGSAPSVATVVSMDVNPSIDMKLDGKDKVLALEAINEDAKDIVQSVSYKNKESEEVVAELIDVLFEKGYLSKEKNSMLISVADDNAARSKEVEERLLGLVKNCLEQKEIAPYLMGQHLVSDEEMSRQAGAHSISVGKARLITEIVRRDATKSFDELAALSVKELALILDAKSVEIQDTVQVGELTPDGYLPAEKIRSIVVEDSGISFDQMRKYEIELDYEKGRMIYEVEFEDENAEYEYDIDAVSGEILDKEIDPMKEKDKKDTVQPSSEYKTKEEIQNIVIEDSGVSPSSMTEYEIKLKKKDQRIIYEVEFNVGNLEYEYDIDAISGEILDKDIDED